MSDNERLQRELWREAVEAAKAKAVPLPWSGERQAVELTMASACTRCGAPRGAVCIRSTHEEQWKEAA